MTKTQRYVALLRGINVGGNKMIRMADLKKVFESLAFQNVKTILATGNIIFDSEEKSEDTLEKNIKDAILKKFKMDVYTLIRSIKNIQFLIDSEPFRGITVTQDTRLYVSFLSDKQRATQTTASISKDKNFKILKVTDTEVVSVITITPDHKTVDLMTILEKNFGKNITTRNWKTVLKFVNK